MQMKKNEKGVTLIALAVMIIVIVIIASVTVYSGTNSIQNAKQRRLKVELDMVQHAVLENYMESRKSYAATQQNAGDIMPIEGVEHPAAVIYPIIASGDVTGAVVMLSSESIKAPSGAEIKLAQSAAVFLGKQMEEWIGLFSFQFSITDNNKLFLHCAKIKITVQKKTTTLQNGVPLLFAR